MNKLNLILSVLAFGTVSVSLAQNVGIGTATPAHKLHISTGAASDGIRIDNTAGNGDPILQYRTNGTAEFTMGVDDSDSDKFKFGTTAITTNTVFTIESNRDFGLRTTTPGHFFHMTNGGAAVGANSMAEFENLGASGVALSGSNTSTTSGYNACEFVTDYTGNGFLTAGGFGLAINTSGANSNQIGLRGHVNEWQGVGVRGSRTNSGGPNSGWGGSFYNDLGYTGFFGVISDKRTKKDITPLSGALGIVMQLNPVSYQYDLDKYPNMGLNEGVEFGFISQEVREVLPEVTRTKTFSTNATEEAVRNGLTRDESEEFVVMDYTRIIPVLTEAIQEQQAIIQEMRGKIETLEEQVQTLQEND